MESKATSYYLFIAIAVSVLIFVMFGLFMALKHEITVGYNYNSVEKDSSVIINKMPIRTLPTNKENKCTDCGNH